MKPQVTKRQLDTFDRLYGMGGPSSPTVPRNSILEKDFECPVCYEVGGALDKSCFFPFSKPLQPPSSAGDVSPQPDLPVQQRPPDLRGVQTETGDSILSYLQVA